MLDTERRRSPSGRPIKIRENRRQMPAWVARRRWAYRVVDLVAEQAKRAVKYWLVPSPRVGGLRADKTHT